ncbi:short-chain dehydrogenase/reductase family 16C member 6-like [Perognathus longimembris pacificus]|uniref:short-chain dehydrogenase/reductase family 16C member 6-like n=1 Tax=Perognathus longimembris pacificus TaxID=214514 RepID=UPI002018D6B5|nr:short-chain dehydrogenase/reductase family 16C member 6-like [Perognathus longimembris pacificus]
MYVIVDTIQFLGKCLYYFSEAFIFKIIPLKRKDVAGEIVLITGGGSGLGRELAIHFATLGSIVVLWDINEEGNMETCRLVKEKGDVKVFAYTCDCSKRQEVYKVAAQVREEVGDVTILINNAGIVTGKPFLDTPDDMIEKSFAVNVISHFWTCKAFLPAMIEANHGHLVCISSVAGIIGINGLTDYSATKFAAFGFAESLFFELNLIKKTNIKTTIICPYLIKTGMFDGCVSKYPFLLPILEQKYVAQKIIDAILEEKVYCTLPKVADFMLYLKHLMAPKMTLAMVKYLGGETFMASFKGRMKPNTLQPKTEEKHQ